MIVRTKDFKNKVALSISRIKKFQHCSQSYYCNYILKIPDKGNSGSLRGSTCHDVLELLNKPRRRKQVDRIVINQTVTNDTGLWKFVCLVAKKYKVDDPENLELIDSFLVTALKCDFWGPENTIHTFIEKEFDLEIEDDGIDCRIRGFIDRFHLVKESNSLVIYAADYKSSSKKLDKNDLETGQALMYQLALSLLYPNVKMRDFRFIFLKFPDSPYQVYTPVDESALNGYLYYLSHIQQLINSFSEKDVDSNYGKLNQKTKFLCGPSKSGWICPHQKPLDYHVLLDNNNDIIKSSFDNNFSVKVGESVEKRSYKGCKHFYPENY